MLLNHTLGPSPLLGFLSFFIVLFLVFFYILRIHYSFNLCVCLVIINFNCIWRRVWFGCCSNYRLMVRTLGFRPKNKGSSPFNLERLRLSISLRFISFIDTNLRGFFKLKKSSRLYSTTYLILLNVFIILSRLQTKTTNCLEAPFCYSFFCRSFRKKFITIQRAPIAHRQWSQEQYNSRFFIVYGRFFLDLNWKLVNILNVVTVPVFFSVLNKTYRLLFSSIFFNKRNIYRLKIKEALFY